MVFCARSGPWIPALGAAWLLAVGCGGGDLSTDQLSTVVDLRQPELKRCYDTALEQHPLRDEIRMEAVLRIAPTGKVASVELDPEPPLQGLAPCLRDAIGRWTFPTAEKATATSLPLVFQPKVVERAVDEALK